VTRDVYCVAQGHTFRTAPGTACSTAQNTNARRRFTLERPEDGGEIGFVAEADDEGTQAYHGMILSLDRRDVRGVTVNANYTWSIALVITRSSITPWARIQRIRTPTRTTGISIAAIAIPMFFRVYSADPPEETGSSRRPPTWSTSSLASGSACRDTMPPVGACVASRLPTLWAPFPDRPGRVLAEAPGSRTQPPRSRGERPVLKTGRATGPRSLPRHLFRVSSWMSRTASMNRWRVDL